MIHITSETNHNGKWTCIAHVFILCFFKSSCNHLLRHTPMAMILGAIWDSLSCPKMQSAEVRDGLPISGQPLYLLSHSCPKYCSNVVIMLEFSNFEDDISLTIAMLFYVGCLNNTTEKLCNNNKMLGFAKSSSIM